MGCVGKGFGSCTIWQVEGRMGICFIHKMHFVTFSKYLADQTKTRSLHVNSNKRSAFQRSKCVATQGGEWANQGNMPHIPAANVCLITDRGTQHSAVEARPARISAHRREKEPVRAVIS